MSNTLSPPRPDISRPTVRAVRRPRAASAAGWAAVAALLAVAAVAASRGVLTRPTSDDYRLTVWARDLGPIGAAEVFYTEVTGRVGNGVINGLVYLSPTWAMRLTPTVVLLGLTLSVGVLFHTVARRFAPRVPAQASLLVGLGVAVVSLVDRPRAYHTLYWTAGALTHAVPPILLCLLIAAAVRVRGRRAKAAMVVLALLGGTVLGTINEPIVLAGGVLGGLSLLTHLLFVRRATFALAFTGAGLAGFTAGALIILTSPGHANTQGHRTRGESRMSAEVVADTLRFTYDVLHRLATTGTLLAAAAVGVLAALVLGRERLAPLVTARPTAPRTLWTLAVPLLAVVLTAVPTMWALRVGWGPQGWRVHRGWFSLSVLACAALAFYGFVAGVGVLRLRPRRLPRLLPLMAAALAVVTVFGAAADYGMRLRKLSSTMEKRQIAWDAQDRRIRAARDAGALVGTADRLRISRLAEPFGKRPGQLDWAAQIVADFYQIDEVARVRYRHR